MIFAGDLENGEGVDWLTMLVSRLCSDINRKLYAQ